MKNGKMILLIAFLAACNSPRAKAFLDEIDTVDNHIAAINNMEGARLNTLVTGKIADAIVISVKQRNQMQALINKLGAMDTTLGPKAALLKSTTFNYVKLMLETKDLDIQEMELKQNLNGKDSTKVLRANQSLYVFTNKRLTLNDKIIETAKQKSRARAAFAAANKLK